MKFQHLVETSVLLAERQKKTVLFAPFESPFLDVSVVPEASAKSHAADRPYFA